jgi:hypothetical protein
MLTVEEIQSKAQEREIKEAAEEVVFVQLGTKGVKTSSSKSIILLRLLSSLSI